MIDQITKGEKDIAIYLKTGKKRNSRLTRDEKDDRLVLAGNLELLESSEKYQRETKNQKYNYYHISLSFTAEEWKKLYQSGKTDNLIKDYLKLHFPNHKLDELLYYAEAHLPIVHEEPYIPRPEYTKDGKRIENNIRLNEKHKNGEPLKREPHIHLVVSFENMKFTGQVRSGGMIFSKNKAQMARSAEKFKHIVNDMISLKYELNTVKPLNKSLEELDSEYEKFKEAAKKVSKGKEKNTEMKENANMPALDAEPAKKDIAIKELLSDNVCSTIDTLLRTVEENETLKKDYYARAKRLQELDISKFIPIIQEKYKINMELVHGKNKVKIEGLNGTHNITDLMCKGVYNSRKGAIFHVVEELESMHLEALAHKNEAKITLSVSDDFKEVPGSTKQKPKYQALNNWKVIEVSPENLDNTLKHYSAISMAEFSGGKREAKNVKGIIPTLIYDIDNSDFKEGKVGYQYTIDNAISMLKKRGVQGYIYPSASHLTDGKTEKFRLLIPTTQAPNTNDYKPYMEKITEELRLNGIVDKVGNSPSQMYYTPKTGIKIIHVQGEVLNNEQILKQAREHVKKIAEINNIDMQKIERLTKEHKEFILQKEPEDNEVGLVRTTLKGLAHVPMIDLARHFDPSAQIVQEGKTQIMEYEGERHFYNPTNNTAYHFRSQRLMSAYTILKDKLDEAARAIKLNTPNIDEITAKLGISEKERGNFNPDNVNQISKFFSRIDTLKKHYWTVTLRNYQGVARVISRHMKSWNDKIGLESVKKHFSLKKAEIKEENIMLGFVDFEKEKLDVKFPSEARQEVKQQETPKQQIKNKGVEYDFGR